MSAAVVPPSPDTITAAPITTSAVVAWDEICRGMGIVPLTPKEAADLPPWTDAEADAFERAVNETGEQIDESLTLP